MVEEKKDIFKDGTRIVTLDSWEVFHHEIHDLKSKRGYVWRGQRKDETSGWFLKSSFDREFQIGDQKNRTKMMKEHLNNFKKEMNKIYPNTLPPDDINIWALGQHYGLKTPLIDWTLGQGSSRTGVYS